MSETRTYDEVVLGGGFAFDMLQAEIAVAFEGLGSTVRCTGVTVDDGEAVGSRLLLSFGSALSGPEIAAVDAVLAAHPSVGPDTSGAVVVASGVPFEIGRRLIEQGDVVVWDVHVTGYAGDQATLQPIRIDAYPQTYRRTAGDVRVDRPLIEEVGSIPGFGLIVTGTSTEAIFELEMKKAGTFTIVEISISEEERYNVPA